jgi:tetraacyldisaccharide 4'-kinase
MSGNSKAEIPVWRAARRILFPVLWPLSLVYGGIMLLRNKLFDIGLKKEQSFGLPAISVGNITVGGTGKTPLTEHVIGILKDKYRVALVSRGYKRKTKGVVIAGKNSTASEIGDEPGQILLKFPEVAVAVAEKRTEGIKALLEAKGPQVIVLDDAYQHRYVKPGLSILLIDYNRPLWKDYPFPAGDLREPLSGKKRADVIIVTKCPSGLTETEKAALLKKMAPEHYQHVFFTTVAYMPAVNLSGQEGELEEGAEVVAVAGIADPNAFFRLLSEKYSPVEKIVYPDHHSFTNSDCDTITGALKKIRSENKAILTTEKDAVRLMDTGCLSDEVKSRIWYIPIKVAFLFGEEKKFNQLIHSYVEENKKDS